MRRSNAMSPLHLSFSDLDSSVSLDCSFPLSSRRLITIFPEGNVGLLASSLVDLLLGLALGLGGQV